MPKSVPYWEREDPITAEVGRHVLRYYRDTQWLNIAIRERHWHGGWTITGGLALNLNHLREHPEAIAILTEVVAQLAPDETPDDRVEETSIDPPERRVP